MLSLVSHSGWAQTRPSEYRREARVMPLIALPLRVSLTGPPFFRYVTEELQMDGIYSLSVAGSPGRGDLPRSSAPGSLDRDKTSIKQRLQIDAGEAAKVPRRCRVCGGTPRSKAGARGTRRAVPCRRGTHPTRGRSFGIRRPPVGQ